MNVKAAKYSAKFTPSIAHISMLQNDRIIHTFIEKAQVKVSRMNIFSTTTRCVPVLRKNSKLDKSHKLDVKN